MQAAIIYVLAVLLANFTATMFLPVPFLFGLELPVAVGTFIFGITFTQRDRMHYMGRRFVYKVILLAALLNLLMLVSLDLWLARLLAETAAEMGSAWLAQSFTYLDEAGLRVYIASFTAIVLAEAADTEVYHRLRRRRWLLRVSGSNAVSVPLDSTLFNLIAFAWVPGFAAGFIAWLIAGEVIVKYTVGGLWGLWRSRAREAEEARQLALESTH